MHEGLERAPRIAEEFVGAADDLLKEIGHRLQPALPVDESVYDRVEQRASFPEVRPSSKIVWV